MFDARSGSELSGVEVFTLNQGNAAPLGATDESGRLDLADVDSAADLFLVRSGYGPRVVSAGNDRPRTVELHQGVSLAGVVIDSDGDPVPGRVVQWTEQGLPSQAVTGAISDRHGAFVVSSVGAQIAGTLAVTPTMPGASLELFTPGPGISVEDLLLVVGEAPSWKYRITLDGAKEALGESARLRFLRGNRVARETPIQSRTTLELHLDPGRADTVCWVVAGRIVDTSFLPKGGGEVRLSQPLTDLACRVRFVANDDASGVHRWRQGQDWHHGNFDLGGFTIVVDRNRELEIELWADDGVHGTWKGPPASTVDVLPAVEGLVPVHVALVERSLEGAACPVVQELRIVRSLPDLWLSKLSGRQIPWTDSLEGATVVNLPRGQWTCSALDDAGTTWGSVTFLAGQEEYVQVPYGPAGVKLPPLVSAPVVVEVRRVGSGRRVEVLLDEQRPLWHGPPGDVVLQYSMGKVARNTPAELVPGAVHVLSTDDAPCSSLLMVRCACDQPDHRTKGVLIRMHLTDGTIRSRELDLLPDGTNQCEIMEGVRLEVSNACGTWSGTFDSQAPEWVLCCQTGATSLCRGLVERTLAGTLPQRLVVRASDGWEQILQLTPSGEFEVELAPRGDFHVLLLYENTMAAATLPTFQREAVVVEPPQGSLGLRIVTDRGMPVSGTRVQLRAPLMQHLGLTAGSSEVMHVALGVTDDRGTVEFEPLCPGEYQLSFPALCPTGAELRVSVVRDTVAAVTVARDGSLSIGEGDR